MSKQFLDLLRLAREPLILAYLRREAFLGLAERADQKMLRSALYELLYELPTTAI